jgi:hypothetical protein
MQPKSKNNKTNNSKNPTKKAYRNKVKRRVKAPAKVARRRRATMPLASRANFTKKFKTLNQTGNSVRVTGRDLMYVIPDDNTAPVQTTQLITVIPANPVYWSGTRIAALAQGYQNYRPIRFKVTYVPIVSAMQQGNVIGGTIWDGGLDNSTIQQSLRTSNGGFLTQCFVPHTSTIRPKTNLQFNLYRIGGAFNQESNPFVFVAISVGCKNANNQRIIPGYFYVTWTFELKNPVGQTTNFSNTGLILYSALTPLVNTTIVNVSTVSEVPFGAYIDIETTNENGKAAYYNGSPVEIDSSSPVWGFMNSNTIITMRTTNIPIYYTSVQTDTPKITVKVPSASYAKYNVEEMAIMCEDPNNTNQYLIFEPEFYQNEATFTKEFQLDFTLLQSEIYMIITDTKQILGKYTETVTQEYGSGIFTYTKYTASKTIFTATISTTKMQKEEPQHIIYKVNKPTLAEEKKVEEHKPLEDENDQELSIHEEEIIEEEKQPPDNKGKKKQKLTKTTSLK